MRAALAWCGAIAYPFALFFAARGTPSDSPGVPFVSAAAVTALSLGLLRRRPLPALALILLGTYVTATTTPFWQVVYLLVLANDLAVGYIVATRPRRVAVTAAVMTLGIQVAFAARLGTGTDGFARTVVVLVLALAAAWMTGHSVRERREHAAALRSQTAAQAVAAERLRIARELHDMIAHSIGVIAIQAGVGRRVIDTQPDEARNALATIEDTSRETLAGLRRTLGALRRAEPGPGAEAAPREPAPGLADLDRLTASTRDAGVHVDVRWLGERRPLPPISTWPLSGSSRRPSPTSYATRVPPTAASPSAIKTANWSSRSPTAAAAASPPAPDTASPECGNASPCYAASSPPGRDPKAAFA